MSGSKGVLNIANNQDVTQKWENNQQNINYPLQQQQQSNLDEEQAIIQYYVYEDFQNFLNLLYSFQAVKNYFINSEHILVKISENKLLTQMNLSNSIHYDLQMTSKNPKLIECLKSTKQKLKSKIREVCPKEFENEIKYYEDYCLNETVSILRLELKATQLKVQFNEGVLQQILPQIQTVDNKVNYIRKNKKYEIPSTENMKKIAEQYKVQTTLKLKEQQQFKQ